MMHAQSVIDSEVQGMKEVITLKQPEEQQIMNIIAGLSSATITSHTAANDMSKAYEQKIKQRKMDYWAF